jgi:DNA-binding transcriptional MerR regulator
MPSSLNKSAGAFRTIGEVAEALDIQQHILRYWETRFPQLRPLQRAGKRRYYRPEDVALVGRINRLLNQEGYTVKGVQKLLAEGGDMSGEAAPVVQPVATTTTHQPTLLMPLMAIHNRLAKALAADEIASRM